jgi:glycosyltransferase involved in cell wall biosynthesis
MNYHQFLVSRDLGGGAQIALDLTQLLMTRGQQARAWIPGPGLSWSHAQQCGLNVQGYDLKRALSSSPLSAAAANWRVWRQLRGADRGLIHVHSPLVYGALRRCLAQSGSKRVVHVHIEQDEEGLRWALRKPPHLIITCARFLVDQVRRALPPQVGERQWIAAVPNSIDTAKFKPGNKAEAKRQVGAELSRPLALMLANLAPHKGQETVIAAAAILKGRGVDINVWLAGIERGGAGAYTARLQTLIQEAGVGDRVRLVGQRTDAPDLLRAADFFLLPSTCEGLPLSILEAQATKVPVLAAPTAGIPEVVCDGATGFLIAADDAQGYARRIEELLANPELSNHVAEAAFVRTTRDHNWQEYCRRIMELYEEVLDRPASDRSGASLVAACRRPVQTLRRSLRKALFSVVRRVLDADDGRAMITDCVQSLPSGPVRGLCQPHRSGPLPYADLGQPDQSGLTSRRSDIIAITGRFRSGSTLLWNLFRHVPGCTAYYEPLNERRWFDATARGARTDATHRNVSDYWREYDGLRELAAHYREEWTRRHLLMDENFWDPDLKRYVEILVERAPGRPVLQFNRIDFRLPWLRRNFPCAKIVHLYRHPRDQWCSSLLDVKCFPRDGRTGDFALHDKFYLLTWASDLKHHFPFLDPAAAEHPYQIFYYVWKLSYLFGRRYADYSLAFEELIGDPPRKLEELFHALELRGADPLALEKLLDAPKLGRWKEYADDAWFRGHETICETVLADFFAAAETNESPIAAGRTNGSPLVRPTKIAALLTAS